MGAELQKETADADAAAYKLLERGNELLRTLVRDLEGGGLAGIDTPRGRDAFCEDVGLYYTDKLSSFNAGVLANASYRLGINVGRDQPRKKDELCRALVGYYQKKKNYLDWINAKKDEAGCREYQRIIGANLPEMIEGASSSIASEATRRYKSLARATVTYSEYLAALADKVSGSLSQEELDETMETAYKDIARLRGVCCRWAAVLSPFLWERKGPDTYRNIATGAYSSVLPPVRELPPPGNPSLPCRALSSPSGVAQEISGRVPAVASRPPQPRPPLAPR